MFRGMVTEPERAASYRRDGRWDSTTLSGRLEAVAAAAPERAGCHRPGREGRPHLCRARARRLPVRLLAG